MNRYHSPFCREVNACMSLSNRCHMLLLPCVQLDKVVVSCLICTLESHTCRNNHISTHISKHTHALQHAFVLVLQTCICCRHASEGCLTRCQHSIQIVAETTTSCANCKPCNFFQAPSQLELFIAERFALPNSAMASVVWPRLRLAHSCEQPELKSFVQ